LTTGVKQVSVLVEHYMFYCTLLDKYDVKELLSSFSLTSFSLTKVLQNIK